MKLSGSYKLHVKKEIVWKSLNDSNILKQCIPGCSSFEKENNEIFNVTATNQIGPMNATFSGTVVLSNIKKNESLDYSKIGIKRPGNGLPPKMLDKIIGKKATRDLIKNELLKIDDYE